MGNFAVMCVPEAPVDENDFLAAGKDQIWSAGELMIVESITITQAVDKLPDEKFGHRVFAPDAAHVLAALRFGEAVHNSR